MYTFSVWTFEFEENPMLVDVGLPLKKARKKKDVLNLKVFFLIISRAYICG